MNAFHDFDKEVVAAIRQHIKSRVEGDGLKDVFPIPCLRDDVFEVLNRYCTVIYYPSEDSSNRGFHVKEYLIHNGKEQNFVFINTSQTLEKQVFTAAHELGHIWQIDKDILQEFPRLIGANADNDDLAEAVINRFAAELLMPEELFCSSVSSDIRQVVADNHDGILKIDLKDALRIVVKRMDQFRAPSGAVVRRLFELRIIPKDSMDILLGEGLIPKEKIDGEIERIILENDYSNLRKPTERKFIPGLAELLDKAETAHCVDESKIVALRKMFGLPQKQTTSELEMNVPIETEGITGK